MNILRRRLILLVLSFKTVHRADIKNQAPDELSSPKQNQHETNINQKLRVLMINEAEEQEDVETEYFDHIQLENEQAGNHMDSKGKETKPLTAGKLLKAHGNGVGARR